MGAEKLQKWNFVAHEILVGKWTNEAKMWGLLSKAGQWEVAMLYRHLIGEILWSISQWLGLHIVHSVQKLKQQRVVTWYTKKKYITNSQTVIGDTQINSMTLVAISNVHTYIKHHAIFCRSYMYIELMLFELWKSLKLWFSN